MKILPQNNVCVPAYTWKSTIRFIFSSFVLLFVFATIFFLCCCFIPRIDFELDINALYILTWLKNEKHTNEDFRFNWRVLDGAYTMVKHICMNCCIRPCAMHTLFGAFYLNRVCLSRLPRCSFLMLRLFASLECRNGSFNALMTLQVIFGYHFHKNRFCDYFFMKNCHVHWS